MTHTTRALETVAQRSIRISLSGGRGALPLEGFTGATGGAGLQVLTTGTPAVRAVAVGSAASTLGAGAGVRAGSSGAAAAALDGGAA
ncbi:MAG TPA: hypothetical protein VLT33_12615, partial [Labilithrix sp.]|nr:hypothetical protein [Labilithrix sp.]